MRKRGFTLLEILIALTITSFVIVGVLQTIRSTLRFVDESKEMMEINRSVGLVFDLLERDFSSVFIFKPKQPIQSIINRKSDDEKLVGDEAEKKGDVTKKKEYSPLISEVYVDEYEKILGKRKKLFKKATFVCSHSLEIYGERPVRLVRLKYELLEDKTKKKDGKKSYNLVRSETEDFENIDFKVPEEGKKITRREKIVTYDVAANIKEFYVEYVWTTKGKKKEDKVKVAYSFGCEDDTKRYYPSL